MTSRTEIRHSESDTKIVDSKITNRLEGSYRTEMNINVPMSPSSYSGEGLYHISLSVGASPCVVKC